VGGGEGPADNPPEPRSTAEVRRAEGANT
jgi:hypothetical protein